jgi:hypothetical protein
MSAFGAKRTFKPTASPLYILRCDDQAGQFSRDRAGAYRTDKTRHFLSDWYLGCPQPFHLAQWTVVQNRDAATCVIARHLHGMTRTSIFPLPFRSLRMFSGAGDASYVIGAMFTAAYQANAERLAASCARYGLPYLIHEVPTVHRSISGKGTEDLAYTKPNFIHFLLTTYKCPVLYLDADCEFMAQPELIAGLVKSRCDFAIYNWFADQSTDCYTPVELSPGEGEPAVKNRFYRFLGSERYFTTKQLKCNGLVQFYGNSIAARALLSRWHRTIASFRGCTDDSALSFTFNNLTGKSWLYWVLKARWLPQPYARISWWICTKPVINHSDLPTKSSRFVKIRDPRGRKQFYHSQMEQRKPAANFSPDCIIDTERHVLCQLIEGQLVSVAQADQTFWL